MKLRHDQMLDYSLSAETILRRAAQIATNQNRSHIGTEHIAGALLLDRDGPHIGVLHSHLMRETVVKE